MTLEQIKLEFVTEYPSVGERFIEEFGKQWHIEWHDKAAKKSLPEDGILSYYLGLWAGFLSGYIRAEKNQKKEAGE